MKSRRRIMKREFELKHNFRIKNNKFLQLLGGPLSVGKLSETERRIGLNVMVE